MYNASGTRPSSATTTPMLTTGDPATVSRPSRRRVTRSQPTSRTIAASAYNPTHFDASARPENTPPAASQAIDVRRDLGPHSSTLRPHLKSADNTQNHEMSMNAVT